MNQKYVKQDIEAELINLEKFLQGFPKLKTVEDVLKHKKDIDVLYVTLQQLKKHLSALTETKEENIIGDTVNVQFVSLPKSKTLIGKVDTGADISSLHVDDFSVNLTNKTISFSSEILTGDKDKIITVQLVDQQAVKTADNGIEYRPVIQLNVKVNDKLIEDVLFNLNNRNGMQHPVLIGQNILEKGKFIIDPTLENTTITKISSDYTAVNLDNIDMKNVVTYLMDNEIKMSDIVKFVLENRDETKK